MTAKGDDKYEEHHGITYTTAVRAGTVKRPACGSYCACCGRGSALVRAACTERSTKRLPARSSSVLDDLAEAVHIVVAERDLFRSNGRIFREGNEMFAEVSWLQVLHGQRVPVAGYHPLVDVYPEAKVVDFLQGVRGVIGKCVEVMPTHDAFIARHCAIAEAALAA